MALGSERVRMVTQVSFPMAQKDTKTVKMMYQKKKFPYGYIQDLKCRVLELPYQGAELSMVILLPDDIQDETTGLKKVKALHPTLPCPSDTSTLPRACVVRSVRAACSLTSLHFLSDSWSFAYKLARQHGPRTP